MRFRNTISAVTGWGKQSSPVQSFWEIVTYAVVSERACFWLVLAPTESHLHFQAAGFPDCLKHEPSPVRDVRNCLKCRKHTIISMLWWWAIWQRYNIKILFFHLCKLLFLKIRSGTLIRELGLNNILTFVKWKCLESFETDIHYVAYSVQTWELSCKNIFKSVYVMSQKHYIYSPALKELVFFTTGQY